MLLKAPLRAGGEKVADQTRLIGSILMVPAGRWGLLTCGSLQQLEEEPFKLVSVKNFVNQTVTAMKAMMKEFISELFRLRGGSSEFHCGSLLHLKLPFQRHRRHKMPLKTVRRRDVPQEDL